MIVLYFVLVLGILIFVHELGHFLVAKLSGVKVEKFSLGFGPKLLGFRYGETEYLVSAFPLGGYVKMFGEGGFNEAEMVERGDYSTEGQAECAPPLTEEEKTRSFAHRPVWQRMAIVLAGPLFNMIFAWMILVMLYLVGMPIMKASLGDVFKDKPAARAGLQKGDLITSVNGEKIIQWEDFSAQIAASKGPMEIHYLRGGKPSTVTVAPEQGDSRTLFGEAIRKPLIGVAPAYEFVSQSFGLFDALALGNAKAVELTKLTLLSLVKMFQGVVPLKTVGGPIMIADMANQAAQAGGASFLLLLAVVSVNLGILNLLPVPILDGGHLLFYTIELITRRPVSQKIREYGQQIGLMLLVSLMVLAFYNDIVRYFFPSQG